MKLWHKIPESVRIAIIIFLVVAPLWILVAIFIKQFLNNFGEGLLIEAFGMLLDIVIIVIIITWFNEKREKRRRIERWQDEIDDFRGWDEREAMYRIVGNIRRLNRDGFYSIDLTSCYLRNASLKKIKLMGAYLRNANLMKADLCEANLKGAILNFADLTGAVLRGADLREANLYGAFLMEADLSGADLREIIYTARWWTGGVYSHLADRIKILDRLPQVKTLFQAKLDPGLEKQIKEHYPNLLEKPEDEDEERDGE